MKMMSRVNTQSMTPSTMNQATLSLSRKVALRGVIIEEISMILLSISPTLSRRSSSGLSMGRLEESNTASRTSFL